MAGFSDKYKPKTSSTGGSIAEKFASKESLIEKAKKPSEQSPAALAQKAKEKAEEILAAEKDGRSTADKFIAGNSNNVHLICCKDSEGRPCFFFLMTSRQKIKMLKMAFARGSVNLDEYGTIVASGFGKRPGEDMCKAMLEKYNVNVAEMIDNED